jgi:hypothetical protein
MTRGAAITLLFTTGCVCFFVLAGHVPRGTAARASAGGVSSAPPAQAPALPSIRIEHELIEVPIVRPPVAPPAAVQPVRRARATQSPVERPTFAVNARRLLLGDGKYRPEPFPRPGARP